jgi:hypothetical protein
LHASRGDECRTHLRCQRPEQRRADRAAGRAFDDASQAGGKLAPTGRDEVSSGVGVVRCLNRVECPDDAAPRDRRAQPLVLPRVALAMRLNPVAWRDVGQSRSLPTARPQGCATLLAKEARGPAPADHLRPQPTPSAPPVGPAASGGQELPRPDSGQRRQHGGVPVHLHAVAGKHRVG